MLDNLINFIPPEIRGILVFIVVAGAIALLWRISGHIDTIGPKGLKLKGGNEELLAADISINARIDNLEKTTEADRQNNQRKFGELYERTNNISQDLADIRSTMRACLDGIGDIKTAQAHITERIDKLYDK